jgi:uncharacterized protein
MHTITRILLIILLCSATVSHSEARTRSRSFSVIGFYTGINDPAHVSYVHEANRWLSAAAAEYHFTYDSTNDWNNMNDAFLSHYQVVLFLDTRPDSSAQRDAFRRYMEKGGAWMGFHFAAFALAQTSYPQNWDWYHNEFLGSGEYRGNTWRPTSAKLRVESRKHPAVTHLPAVFSSAPNEWYSWNNDLRKNPDITVLLSIDSTSFPLGTGPKLHEIWHGGDYPVAWTNRNYRMIYVNMGHNDMDYEHDGKELSHTFDNKIQSTFIIDALLWLGRAD